MSRASNGIYTLPNTVNPVVAGTTITDTWANTTLDDIATAMTDSLDRNGRGSMNAPLKLTAGTAGLPGLTFALEPTSGFYRVSSGSIGLSVGAANVMTFSVAEVEILTALQVSGMLTGTDAVFSGTVSLDDGVAANDAVTKGQLDTKLTASLVSAFMLTLLNDLDAAAARVTLGTATLPRNTTALTLGEMFVTAAGFTINTGLAVGNVYNVYNPSDTPFTLTQGAGLAMRLSGTVLTGNRTIGPRATFSIWVDSTTEYVISGSGVT